MALFYFGTVRGIFPERVCGSLLLANVSIRCKLKKEKKRKFDLVMPYLSVCTIDQSGHSAPPVVEVKANNT